MQHEGHLRSVCKWMMDLKATKHMTLQRTAFDTYEVISPHNMHLDDDNLSEAIGMGSIVVGIETKGKTTIICIMDKFL